MLCQIHSFESENVCSSTHSRGYVGCVDCDICCHVGLCSLAGEFFPEAAQIAYKMWELSAMTKVQVGPVSLPSLDVSLSLAWHRHESVLIVLSLFLQMSAVLGCLRGRCPKMFASRALLCEHSDIFVSPLTASQRCSPRKKGIRHIFNFF